MRQCKSLRRRRARAAGRGWRAAAVAGAAVALAACRVFSSLPTCAADGDCDLGYACDGGERVCRRDTGPVVIGALLPREGAPKANGDASIAALELVESLINDSYGNTPPVGVLGRDVTFRVAQDRPNEVTLANTQRLIDVDRVAAFVGATSSSIALLAQSVAAPAQTLFISAYATSPKLAEAEPPGDRYFYRAVSDTTRGEALAMALFSREPPEGAACASTFVVGNDSAFAQAYVEAYRQQFATLGGCFLGQAVVATTVAPSYADVIDDAVARKPECVLMLLTIDTTVAFLAEAKARPSLSGTRWLSGSSVHSLTFATTARTDPVDSRKMLSDDVYVSDNDSNPDTDEYRAFRHQFNAFYGLPLGEDTPPSVSNMFDAAVLAVAAVERAGRVDDRVAIRDAFLKIVDDAPGHAVYGPDRVVEMMLALRRAREFGTCGTGPDSNPCEVRYRGASGPLVFDATGSARTPTVVYKTTAGTFAAARSYPPGAYEEYEKRTPVGPSSACP